MHSRGWLESEARAVARWHEFSCRHWCLRRSISVEDLQVTGPLHRYKDVSELNSLCHLLLVDIIANVET